MRDHKRDCDDRNSGNLFRKPPMLPRSIIAARALSRSYATAAPPHDLVFLEHRQGVLDPGSLSALTAAEQLGGKVTGLVVGAPEHVEGVVEKAKKSVLLRLTFSCDLSPIVDFLIGLQA